MPEDIGFIVTVYSGRGLPPERTDFEDKVKAEKAFTDAKFAATLWQQRPPTEGLGWVRLKDKEAPPPAPPAAAKPAAPVVAKPAAPVVATPAAVTPALATPAAASPAVAAPVTAVPPAPPKA